jgi:hypothetical protein
MKDFAISPLTAERWPALEAELGWLARARYLFPGTASAFARHGFQVVAWRKPDRPVMRRDLSGPA